MDEPRKKRDHPLARLEQYLAYVVMLAGLAAWVAFRPPPDHWLPIAVLILATIGIIAAVAVSLRKSGSDPP